MGPLAHWITYCHQVCKALSWLFVVWSLVRICCGGAFGKSVKCVAMCPGKSSSTGSYCAKRMGGLQLLNSVLDWLQFFCFIRCYNSRQTMPLIPWFTASNFIHFLCMEKALVTCDMGTHCVCVQRCSILLDMWRSPVLWIKVLRPCSWTWSVLNTCRTRWCF
jgi:hypothetical protein